MIVLEILTLIVEFAFFQLRFAFRNDIIGIPELRFQALDLFELFSSSVL